MTFSSWQLLHHVSPFFALFKPQKWTFKCTTISCPTARKSSRLVSFVGFSRFFSAKLFLANTCPPVQRTQCNALTVDFDALISYWIASFLEGGLSRTNFFNSDTWLRGFWFFQSFIQGYRVSACSNVIYHFLGDWPYHMLL